MKAGGSGGVSRGNTVIPYIGEIARCLTSDRKDRYLTYLAPSYLCEAFTGYYQAAQDNTEISCSKFEQRFELNKDLSVRGSPLENLRNSAKIREENQSLDEAQSEDFQNTFHDTMCSMESRLFTTEEEYVGMAPYRVENGDMVCVLLGYNIR